MECKTRKQIIDETAAAYTSKTRAVGFDGSCFYKTEDGRCCAIGRCCIDPSGAWRGNWIQLEVECNRFLTGQREELLKPEYRGHSAHFWLDVQAFHDDARNWNESGLTQEGQYRLCALHMAWD